MNISKVGGLPTYLPENYPCYPSGRQEAFLMQLYCDPNMFLNVKNIENIRCWQMYQPKSGGVIETILTLPLSAEINKEQLGTCVDYLDEYIIEFEEGEEPDIWDIDNLSLYESKIGGAIPERYIGEGEENMGTSVYVQNETGKVFLIDRESDYSTGILIANSMEELIYHLD